MRILGIDPGYALVGWGVLDISPNREISLIDCGVIQTPASNSVQERLAEIGGDMKQIVDQFQPDYAGIETLIFSRNITTAMSVSEARGVISYILTEKGVPIESVTPLQVKGAVTGYGRASKQQVQENVRIMCGLEKVPKPDDAADAIAVAICASDIILNRSLSSR